MNQPLTVADFLRWSPTMTPLKAYVVRRLGPDDFFSPDRSQWLDECNQWLEGEPTDASVLAAAEKSIADRLERGVGFSFDPFDMLHFAGLWAPDPAMACEGAESPSA